MNIQPLSDLDEDAVIALWETTGLTVNPLNNPRSDITLCRSTGHGEVLVGKENGELVASLMVGHDGHRGWFYYLATKPNRQRQGWGRRMINAGEAWLRKRSIPKVLPMYKQAGFIPYKREESRQMVF